MVRLMLLQVSGESPLVKNIPATEFQQRGQKLAWAFPLAVSGVSHTSRWYEIFRVKPYVGKGTWILSDQSFPTQLLLPCQTRVSQVPDRLWGKITCLGTRKHGVTMKHHGRQSACIK
jgi:hypothetical protein